MSNKLGKYDNNSNLVLPGDDIVVGKLEITQTGRVKISAPTVPPLILIRMLNGIAVGLLDAMIREEEEQEQKEKSFIIGKA